VRIAFVEQQEQGPKLPLLLDETLGNSDERRAQAIIDAAMHLARDGRQIFYLTAQHDEVDKWQGALARSDVPHRLIDLVLVRNLAEADRLPLGERIRPDYLSVPAPNGYDRRGYAELLGVPEIDPHTPLGGVHLWHLLDDMDALHRLLSLGITTWGQLEALDGVSATALSEHAEALAACRTRAGMMEAVLECWSIGRGKPVDRVVLRQSGQITDVFFERVRLLAEELNGNAAALVAALSNGRLKGYRAATIPSLNSYFEEHGYIDPASPLPATEARLRALAVARGSGTTSQETEAWIDAIVTVLWIDETE
jgi:hypothetical protein